MRSLLTMSAHAPHAKSRGACRFVHDQRGASAVEFALLVPVLIGLYLAAVEVNNALSVYRRTLQVAATAADLTAQVESVSRADIADIHAASASILTPYATAPLKVVLTSVVAGPRRGRVRWSCSNTGDIEYAWGTKFDVPDGLTEPGSSVIVAEVTYAFEPLVGLNTFFSLGSFTMARTFYARPRRSQAVKKTDRGCLALASES